MEIHHYHPETGEWLSTGAADVSPLDADEFLVPAYATPDAPPSTGEHEIAVYLAENGRPPFSWPQGAWSVVSDFRGMSLFRKSDGAPYSLNETYAGLGPLPADVTSVVPPSSAHVWSVDGWVLDPTRAAEQRRVAAEREQDARVAHAKIEMEPLQFAAELGEATDSEAAALLAWKRYVVQLSRIDLSAEQITWPEPPAP